MDIRFFDVNDIKEFNSVYKKVSSEDFGYDLFDMPPAFAAYVDGKPVGIATLFTYSDDVLFPGVTNGEHVLQAELTIFVLPGYRRQGVATELALRIKDFAGKNCPDIPVVYTLPKELSHSSFAKRPAYSELLLQLNPTDCRLPARESIINSLHANNMHLVNEGGNPNIFIITCNHTEIARVNIDSEGSIACLYGLFVSPEYRRRGFGFMLTEYGLSYFTEKNIPVILNVRDTNIAAMSLYKKIGFNEADRVVFYEL